MLDGRHTGTGGGNHFVLGGATAGRLAVPAPARPAAQPARLLAQPPVAVVPVLGPVHRPDQPGAAHRRGAQRLGLRARDRVRRAAAPAARGRRPCRRGWSTALFRNLLIDVTGNTHRAEFCIDKLYSPDGPTGRLGLLELRAFEMPPHARMSLDAAAAAARAGRALLAAAVPARAPDALGHRAARPLHAAALRLAGLRATCSPTCNDAGYPLDADWFAPHFEFRFPRLGDFAARGVDVELRQALEPWHVLGEEGARRRHGALRRLLGRAPAGARSTGLVGDRHVLTCNGRALPLQPTGTVGEFVGGVRYRAWQPPSALHPTIGVHAPLTFDLRRHLDEPLARRLPVPRGAPGRPQLRHLPGQRLRGRGRRLARFFRIGHTPGAMSVPPDERNPDFPFTLDLRRATVKRCPAFPASPRPQRCQR